jgi:alkylhydroperoxidase/carboxymuconolactone decarboxylase family protein YurZ
MARTGKPPKTYESFVGRFPELGRAWELMRQAESKGTLDEKTVRLVKLGVALGSMKEGAVHSAVRKALAAGASREDIEQVIALAASTIGLPSTVAIYSWIREVIDKQ